MAEKETWFGTHGPFIYDDDYVLDEDGNITGYKATVATKNTKGELIDTGIEVFSGAVNNDGEIESSGVWYSQSYKEEATKAEEEN